MGRARIYLRNLTANWVGYGANLLITFFMSPFVVHTLGDTRYGIWSLMMTMTGYLGLVEIGTRGGLGRFINYYLGKNDIPKLNGTLNTAMAMFIAAGMLLTGLAIGLVFTLPIFFPKIPGNMLPVAKAVLMLVALNVWLSFFSAGFRQILIAHERFELTNAVDLGVMLVRTASALIVLSTGHGLVLLAATHTSASMLGVLAVYLLAKRIFPHLELRPSLVSGEHFKELFGFSIWAFISSVSFRLLYSADTIVIGIVLGPKWITFYAIGGMLLYKAQSIITQAASIFGPKMIQACAQENWSALRIDFRRATNLAMGMGILLFGGMIAFGREFIILWMGPQYEISYRVMLVLTISSFANIAFSSALNIYSGLNRMKFRAVQVLAQGLANIGLTLILVVGFNWGILGVAWGTFFPRIAFSILHGFIALHWIHYSFGVFFRQNIIRWVIAGICFTSMCWGISLLQLPGSWIGFFSKVTIACLVYIPIGFFVVFEWADRIRIKKYIIRRFRHKGSPIGNVSKNSAHAAS